MASHLLESRLRWLLRLTLAGTVFTAIVILVGAWTRLVDAGLGCPDWPGCYGRLVVPDTGYAALRHPESPLEPFKAWMEMIHRYIATLLGVAVLGVVALGWRLRHARQYPWRLSIALLVVILLQGAFGAFTVTLQLWPQVVTLHLLGGLSVLIIFLWLHLRLRRFAAGRPYSSPRRLNALWLGAAAILVMQLALGGWVSSNYAGIACQGFPACNGQWWPEMDVSEGFHLTQTVGPNYLYGQLHADARTAIHIAHRLGAVLSGIALLTLWLRYRQQASLRAVLSGVVAVYFVQGGLGVANVLLGLPLWLALLHTAGAIALTLGLVTAFWTWRHSTGWEEDITVIKEASHANA
ncbi:COX15/CtaA family protein [Halomonas sediminis]|uniref:Heme A synthase n=1 Tax=Vreelandella zhuhanensis TaxID=2684210 RepID=A0A7X3H254_9GAMM|nr:COX15/CtaA family protein [Halomonas zhuhanensis]MWJ28253.1 heme A synthase [Halomonas zhuhanensis]